MRLMLQYAIMTLMWAAMLWFCIVCWIKWSKEL